MATDEYTPPIDPKEGLYEFDDFLGLRNNVSAETFAAGDLVAALNVDISDDLNVHRRKGYSTPVTAAVDRSLWASGSVCLGVGSDALKMVHPNWTTTTLRSGLSAGRPLSYAALAARVYYSNGAETGCVEDGTSRSWGLVVPAAPVLTAGPGALPAGKYQVVVTYLREDGQESGAPKASTIELAATGGIDVSAIPVSADPSVNHRAVYATPVNGETLYRVGLIDNAVTTFAIREQRMGTQPLTTQFLAPAPAGDHIGYFKGQMLVAQGTRLYPSEPYAPELFDLRRSLPFLGNITMVAPLDTKAAGGVWIGTDSQVIYIKLDRPLLRNAGEPTESWEYKTVADYAVIPGTLAYADGELLGDGSKSGQMLACFATARGLCVGESDGSFHNLTAARFAYPSMDRGAGLVRRHAGMIQYVATLEGTEVAGNVAA